MNKNTKQNNNKPNNIVSTPTITTTFLPSFNIPDVKTVKDLNVYNIVDTPSFNKEELIYDKIANCWKFVSQSELYKYQ